MRTVEIPRQAHQHAVRRLSGVPCGLDGLACPGERGDMNTNRTSLKRIIGAAGATAALLLAVPATAQAADTIDYTLTRAEVAQQAADAQSQTDLICGALPWPISWACSQNQANGGMRDALQDAYVAGCGLRVQVTPTGSGASYDKATYQYTKVNCR